MQPETATLITTNQPKDNEPGTLRDRPGAEWNWF